MTPQAPNLWIYDPEIFHHMNISKGKGKSKARQDCLDRQEDTEDDGLTYFGPLCSVEQENQAALDADPHQ
jgi:hypothetical protein